MAEKLANPGVIGETYQDRKHPDRLGVLESRNEKFKTLMFRDKEGNTFNIQYSTFRSQWRKYQGDEVLQTSSQKEAEAQKEEIEVAQAKENLAEQKVKKSADTSDRRSIRISPEEKRRLIDDVKLTVEDASKKCNSDVIFFEHTSKDGERLYYLNGKKKVTICMIWTLFSKNLGKVRFYMSKEAFHDTEFSKQIGDIRAKISENPNEPLQASFVLTTDLLSQAVKDIYKSLEPVYADKVKTVEKEEKEKK